MICLARSGHKVLHFEVFSIDDLEDIIDFANSKGKRSGLRVLCNYAHDQGLRISLTGPKDKINLFEHQLREFVSSLASEEEYDEDDIEIEEEEIDEDNTDNDEEDEEAS